METIAFHQSYIKDLPGVEGTEEDYDEFAHLNKVADDPGTDGDAESDMASDSEMLSGSESGGAKATSAFDFRKQLREMASQGKDLLGEEELQDAEDFVNSFMPSSDGLLPAEYANITEMQLPRHKVNKVQRNELDVVSGQSLAKLIIGLSSFPSCRHPVELPVLWVTPIGKSWPFGQRRTKRPVTSVLEELLRPRLPAIQRWRLVRRSTKALWTDLWVCLEHVRPFGKTVARASPRS